MTTFVGLGDVAKLYVLALEKGEPGARYNASVEEDVTARAIAEAIGQGTGLPVRSVGANEVEHHFGWMAPFEALDMSASNAWTRVRLGWEPIGPDLLTDLAAMDFSALAEAASTGDDQHRVYRRANLNRRRQLGSAGTALKVVYWVNVTQTAASHSESLPTA